MSAIYSLVGQQSQRGCFYVPTRDGVHQERRNDNSIVYVLDLNCVREKEKAAAILGGKRICDGCGGLQETEVLRKIKKDRLEERNEDSAAMKA